MQSDDSESESETDTEADTTSESDSDDDKHVEEGQGREQVAGSPIPASLSTTPAIEINHAPKYRTPPPRPTGGYPKARAHSITGQSGSALSRPISILSRKQSEGSLSSHLVIPSEPLPGLRPRAGSHSEGMMKSLSHSRFISEGAFNHTLVSTVEAPFRSPSPLLLSSPSWSSTVALSVANSLNERERKRQEAIHELITTEQVYLSYLYLVRDDFQRPLLNQALISPAESQVIFLDWSSLLDLSQTVVRDLEERRENGNGVVLAVGDIINSCIVERANCFLRYCSGHREASVLLSRKISESRGLQDFLKLAKSNPSCRGLDISSFLLQPLQRITRYPLLIKKILEYTDDDHLDHLLLSEALLSAEKFLDQINETIRTSETRQRLQEIERKMPSGDTSEGLLLTSETKYLGHRCIIQEGHLRKAKSGRRLYGYLCNDLLLLFIPGRTDSSLAKSQPYGSMSMSSPSLGLSPSTSTDWGQAQGNRGWTLYHPPIPIERLKVKADSGDETKLTLLLSSQLSSSQHDHVPVHLRTHSQQQPQGSRAQQSLIQLKAGSARERRIWVGAMEKAIEAMAKAPREYGMRTSIRPPLAETIGTMTIRVQEAVIPSAEFAKTKSFQCTISLGGQLFTTQEASSDQAYSGHFSILWRESVIFSITHLSQVLDVKVMCCSPFSPDVFMGSQQIPFHTVVPFGERGTDVHVTLNNDIQVKFYMSYKAL